MNFLIVEDDALARLNLQVYLKKFGIVSDVESAKAAIKYLENNDVDMVFIDLDLEKKLAGLKVIEAAVKKKCYSVVLSGHEDDESIQKAYELGASDYIAKPFMGAAIDSLIAKYKMISGDDKFQAMLETSFVTSDHHLISQLKFLPEVILSERPVYIRGETGTGKTELAKIIHKMIFGEGNKKFVHLNCAEIPENLLESELFGHEKGAFTGATSAATGKLLQADGGTLFLDEIGVMPMSIQQKLLRVIEEKSFSPIGSTQVVKSNFRLISATCDDLENMVREKLFREDLYFRLEGYNVILPPLRERIGDIVKLLNYFMKQSNRRVVFKSAVISAMKKYSWPGNVRELKKFVSMMCAKSTGIIDLCDMPAKMFNDVSSSEISVEALYHHAQKIGLKEMLDDIAERVFAYALERNDNVMRQVMSDIKISSSSFYRFKERIDGKD